jgi:hypothetical protein
MRNRQVSRPTWPQPQASLAPWSARQDRQRRDIVLVQGPAGSGKSLFAWSLYSRFGQSANATTLQCSHCMQTPRLRRRTR